MGITSQATLDYWRVAKAFNGHPDAEPLTVEQAFGILREHLDWMGSHRRIVRRMQAVHKGIIEGKPKRRAKERHEPKRAQLRTITQADGKGSIQRIPQHCRT